MHWQLKYIDKGSMMFIYQPQVIDDGNIPEILEENSVLYDLPRIYRDRFAFFLYLVQYEMLKKGRLKDVHDFNDKNRELITHMQPYMPLEEKEKLQLLLTTLTDVYGKTNSDIIQYEMLHYAFLNRADPSQALAYGQKVLQAVPHRYPIILNVASLYSQNQQWPQSQNYLDRLWEAKETDAKFWKENHYNIAKLYLNLFFMRKKAGDYLEAYTMLRKAKQADANIIEAGKLYNEGIEFVRDLTQSGNSYQAYELLIEMKNDYANSGRLMNEIAWHILTHPQSVFESAETAKQYALKAVKFMEQDQDPLLDASYDTLAEAYFQLEQYDKMKHYERLASKVAPAERKKLHKARTPKSSGK
jgi:tetratricopeptide (TPR) repeat protein